MRTKPDSRRDWYRRAEAQKQITVEIAGKYEQLVTAIKQLAGDSFMGCIRASRLRKLIDN